MSGQPFLLVHVCQEGFGQLRRGEEAGCPKSSTREAIKEEIGQQKTLWIGKCPKAGEL